MNDLTDRFKTPTKINEGLPRTGILVSVDGLPEMGADYIIQVDSTGKHIAVRLRDNDEWAYWNNCTVLSTECART